MLFYAGTIVGVTSQGRGCEQGAHNSAHVPYTCHWGVMALATLCSIKRIIKKIREPSLPSVRERYYPVASVASVQGMVHCSGLNSCFEKAPSLHMGTVSMGGDRVPGEGQAGKRRVCWEIAGESLHKTDKLQRLAVLLNLQKTDKPRTPWVCWMLLGPLSTLGCQLHEQDHVQGGSSCSVQTFCRITPAAKADPLGDLPRFFLKDSGTSVRLCFSVNCQRWSRCSHVVQRAAKDKVF